MYDTSYQITYKPLVQKQLDATTVQLTLQGALTASIFNKNALSKMLLGTELEKFSEEVDIQGLENLTFTPSSTERPVGEQNPLTFTMSGPLTIVARIDPQTIATQLQGQSRKEVQTILDTNTNSIEAIRSTIIPFWKNTFPTDMAKIKVLIENKK